MLDVRARHGGGAAGFAVADVPRIVLLVVEVVSVHVRPTLRVCRPGGRLLRVIGLIVLTVKCMIICYCITALSRMHMLAVVPRARPVVVSNEATIVIGERSVV